ncbi:hypothetical protein FRB90_002094, partial [Tulasnella sp. 427]
MSPLLDRCNIASAHPDCDFDALLAAASDHQDRLASTVDAQAVDYVVVDDSDGEQDVSGGLTLHVHGPDSLTSPPGKPAAYEDPEPDPESDPESDL